MLVPVPKPRLYCTMLFYLFLQIQEFIEVTIVTDDEIVSTMNRCYADNGKYVICPHTATALTAAYRCVRVANLRVKRNVGNQGRAHVGRRNKIKPE